MANDISLEQVQPGALHGRFVEIHDVDGEVEARDCLLSLVGESVHANQKRGRAYWDEEQGQYVVATLDGLLLVIPEANVVECDHLGPRDGGFDLVWPLVSQARSGTSFALRVAETIWTQGFCLIQMPQPDLMQPKMLAATKRRTDYAPLRREFEEAYLGHGSKDKVIWLEGEPWPSDPEANPLAYYSQHLIDLGYRMMGACEQFLGFTAGEFCGTLLRVPMTDESGGEGLSPLDADAVAAGEVERYLDFVQRRRLCLMYVISSRGGSIQLYARDDPGQPSLELRAASGQLFLFRHDRYSYSYKPIHKDDLVLQTWILEAPRRLRLDGFEGGTAGMERILGGPSIGPDLQVHLMSAGCRFPGCAYGLECDWLAYQWGMDTFSEVPVMRWDFTPYYCEPGGAMLPGKAPSKHAGFLTVDEMKSFDNRFFNMDEVEATLQAPLRRILLEIAFETLHGAGYTLQSLQGENIMNVVGDIGLEGTDMFFGYHEAPLDWLRSEAVAPHQQSANRLAYTFGLRGQSVTVDTACSASMSGTGICHSAVRKPDSKGTTKGQVSGLMQLNSPFPFLGLSSAGMLGWRGRCLTFDLSANGYNRGEGVGSFYIKQSDDAAAARDRLCSLVSTYVNQDGRSASLTAPNGPSQQAVIRGSHAQGYINPHEMVNTENHGTGTALGDPIENGSVRNVFKGRATPLAITSGKSHMGHTEAAAGTLGIIKCLVSLHHACTPPNCHLRELNANIDPIGFPHMFNTEPVDSMYEYSYAGANGFGFGGTNARADLWAHRFHRRTETVSEAVGRLIVMDKLGGSVPLPREFSELDALAVACARCSGPMCWLCGAVPGGALAGAHRCSAVRAEPASYEYCSNCYEGAYACGDLAREPGACGSGPVGAKVFLTGTWDAWTELKEMAPVQGGVLQDVYECEVSLSDVRWERFHVVLLTGRGGRSVMHPAAKDANQAARIIGPVAEAQGKHWLIDGFRDGVPTGTVYRVRLEWGEFQTAVTWQPTKLRTPTAELYRHTYYIVDNITGWEPVEGMQDPQDPTKWHWCKGQFSDTGRAEVLFLRDRDREQMVYPLEARPDDMATPVMGPDDAGDGKRWLAWGVAGEHLVVQLQVSDGAVSVSMETETMGRMAWESASRPSRYLYFVAGTWNGWAPCEMDVDGGNPEVQTCLFEIGEAGQEEFQVVVNQNWQMRMYPTVHGESPGESAVCGPDRRGAKKSWRVVGPPGQAMEVRLDLGAADHREVVTCRPCYIARSLADDW